MSRTKKCRPGAGTPKRQVENRRICKIVQLSNKYNITHPAERQLAGVYQRRGQKIHELLQQKNIYQQGFARTLGISEFDLARRPRNSPLSDDTAEVIQLAAECLERLKMRSERRR